MKKHIIYLFVALTIVGCSRYPADVEQVLKFAGNNRGELEKTLVHYSRNPQDSLKFKAACFLIGNMRYHYTRNSKKLDAFRHYALDTIPSSQTYKNFQKKYGQLNSHYHVTYDAQVITAEYLIRNIDFSFRMWEETLWGKHYPFDVFCEELLPYRIGTEPIEDWKEVYHNRYQGMLDTANYDRSSPLAAWRVLFDYFTRKTPEGQAEWAFAYDLTTPGMGAFTLLDLRYGNCQEQTDMFAYVMRSVGIAGGIDMMVQHPDERNLQHWWNYIRDTNGLCITFDFYYEMDDPAEKMTCIHKCGIAYRKCFALQEESLPVKYRDSEVYVPPSLGNPFVKNVSNLYFDENPVILPVGGEYANGDILYLSVFNNSAWIPVTWDEVRDGHVAFRYLEPNILYQLTAFSREGAYRPASDPFILHGDGPVYFARPDGSRKQDMRLSRKYKFPWWFARFRDKAVGGKFQLSNRPDFSDAVTVYTIPDSAVLRYIDVPVNNPKQFRYARYLSAPNGFNLMAEVQFFSGEEQLQGEVTGTEGSYEDAPDRTKHSVFDGDVLTFYSALEPDGAWAGLAFDRPQRISRIRYWFRYDDNTVREGDMYELLYWDTNGWVSAGRQTATDTLLHYRQVPAGTLYWLRNHTRGREERPFTYENGKQVFY